MVANRTGEGFSEHTGGIGGKYREYTPPIRRPTGIRPRAFARSTKSPATECRASGKRDRRCACSYSVLVPELPGTTALSDGHRSDQVLSALVLIEPLTPLGKKPPEVARSGVR
ncbi:hypothetical protein SAMN04487819_108269 [Actinopolyspora alba]|uniref:Uncharacterized protein n=1 Tax=Actinopolyspora alba TaxID=673379 RepID=A0A1I1Y968_9ACTN|nr:hypothetical protein SAMN04487819_108269 [Actinopolyspora alba]